MNLVENWMDTGYKCELQVCYCNLTYPLFDAINWFQPIRKESINFLNFNVSSNKMDASMFWGSIKAMYEATKTDCNSVRAQHGHTFELTGGHKFIIFPVFRGAHVK